MIGIYWIQEKIPEKSSTNKLYRTRIDRVFTAILTGDTFLIQN